MKTVIIISAFVAFALLVFAIFVPIESKELVESCGPDKSRFSLILGEKSDYDSYQNGTQREAICPTGKTNLSLYIL